jgi:glucokinase
MSELLVGVDLGGTRIKAAVADGAGRILVHATVPTESYRGPEGVIDIIAGLVQRLATPLGGSLHGLGMGVPGLIDIATGTTKFMPNFPTQWRDVPVARMLTDKLQCPVRLLNDVRTAALGELKFGHGQQQPDLTMAFFAIGTGVGGAVVVDGKLRLGPLGAAGELGHQTLLPDGPRCGCGNHGCLETLASGPAITAEGVRLLHTGLAPRLYELVAGDAGRVNPREMQAAAIAGDELVREALDRAATYLGIAAANVVTVLHPDLIVLAGGVAELGDILLDRVRLVIRQRVGMFPAHEVRVEQSLLGEQVGMLGAIALAGEF